MSCDWNSGVAFACLIVPSRKRATALSIVQAKPISNNKSGLQAQSISPNPSMAPSIEALNKALVNENRLDYFRLGLGEVQFDGNAIVDGTGPAYSIPSLYCRIWPIAFA